MLVFPISIKQHPQVESIDRYGARRSFSQASRSDGEKQSVRYRLRLERVRCIQPDLVALERPASVAAGTRTRPQIVTGKIHRPSPIMHLGDLYGESGQTREGHGVSITPQSRSYRRFEFRSIFSAYTSTWPGEGP